MLIYEERRTLVKDKINLSVFFLGLRTIFFYGTVGSIIEQFSKFIRNLRLAKKKPHPLGLILNMLIFPKIKGFFQKLFNICGSSGFKLDRSNLRLAEKKKTHPLGFFPRTPCSFSIFSLINFFFSGGLNLSVLGFLIHFY